MESSAINEPDGPVRPSQSRSGSLLATESDPLLSDAPHANAEKSGDRLATPVTERVRSLDQFRGFVILYSLICPMLGYLQDAPPVFKHTLTFFTLADATVRMFYVAIGFAMQLTLLKLSQRSGFRAVVTKQLRRSATLFVIGLLLYGVNGFSSWYGPDGMAANWWKIFYPPYFFETISIIAVAQIIALPVIARPWWWRLAYFWLLQVVFTVGQYAFWFERMWTYCDGGLWGLLSSASVIIAGTFLHDFVVFVQRRRRIDAGHGLAGRHRTGLLWTAVLVAVALVAMFMGVAYSAIPQNLSPVCFHVSTLAQTPCEGGSRASPPFVVPPDDVISMFSMCHWSLSFSIQMCGIGFAVAVFACWYLISDEYGVTFEFLNTLSQNALLIYILRNYAFGFAQDLFPSDGPLWLIPLLLLVSFSFNLAIIFYLKRNNIYLRV